MTRGVILSKKKGAKVHNYGRYQVRNNCFLGRKKQAYCTSVAVTISGILFLIWKKGKYKVSIRS